MDSTKKEYELLREDYRRQQYKRCNQRLEVLGKSERFELSEDATLFNVIMQNNTLICDYLESNLKGSLGDNRCASLQRGFYGLIKECIFKTKSSEVELVIINNALQCCCSYDIYNENGISNYECISGVVIALKKVLATLIGLDFKPPITIKLGNPASELMILIEDVVDTLPNCDVANRFLLSSSLNLFLQVLFVLSGSCSSQASPDGNKWKSSVLKTLSLKVPAIIQFLKLDETYLGSKPLVKEANQAVHDSNETSEMEVDIDVKESRLGESGAAIIKNIPMFTCNVIGDGVFLKDYLQPNAIRNETVHCLLYTLSLVHDIFGSSTLIRDLACFKNDDSANLYINMTWKYLQGYMNFKNGKLEEAMVEMDNLDFSLFPPHFKSKKALLTAAILSKLGKHMMALTVLNKEAIECEDCLPYSLFYIAKAFECLHHKESQLEVLRKLVKVLKHENHLRTLKHSQFTLFFRTIDLIHPLHEVTLEIALEKLTSELAQNKLYEELAECFLDLVALLEKTGPARKFRHHLQNAAAALLLVSENTEVDRTKDAISLCSKAVSIFQKNNINFKVPSCSLKDSSGDGPSECKRAKLELDVEQIFHECDSVGTFEELADAACDFEPDDVVEMKMLEEDEGNKSLMGEVSSASIYSSLLSSEYDLLSSVLLSECALRENDFSKSLHLLNRCLQYFYRYQVLERSKVNSRDAFINTTDFIVSHVWLKKAKVLMKKELTKGDDFSKDIEHCFRNALIRCPGNTDIKYHYVDYMMASGRKGSLNEIQSISQPKNSTCVGVPYTASLAIWYIFRSQVTEVQFENLIGKLKGQ